MTITQRLETPQACLAQLDELNTQLSELKNEWENATGEVVLLEGELEYREAQIYDSLDEVAATTRKDLARAKARVELEDKSKLVTRLREARAKKEMLDRAFKVLDVWRSNVQSQLRAMTDME